MYCDRCGSALNQNAQFCAHCGKLVIGGAAPMPHASGALPPAALAGTQGRVQRHIQLLAGLWLANGILRMVEVGWFMLAGHFFFWPLRGMMGGWGLEFLISRSIFSAGIFLAFFGVVHFVLAWGLFERQPWARVLGLVVGFLALLRFPFGTALGIYTIWVLLPESSGQEYDRLARAY